MTHSEMDWRQLVSLGEGDEFRIQSPSSGSGFEETIRFPLRLVAWLNEAIQDGASLEPPREAGGVLVGDISQASQSLNGSTLDVSVEMFLPIACSDSGGPLYRLSESDKEAMREQLEGVGVSSMVVGLYRTNFRPDVELDEADEALATELLTHPGSLFLILKPDATDGPQATLFLRGAESICREPALAFPFDYVQLNGLRAPHAPVDEEPPAQTAGPVDPALLAVLPPSPAVRRWALAGGMAALLALAFAAGKTWVARRPAAVTTAAPAAELRSGVFNLKAVREQDHLRITWDPQVLPLDTREGALLITDGEMKTQIPMDASAVSQGSVEYYPRSDFLRLELRMANLSDMVMVAGFNGEYPSASPSPGTQIAKNEAPRAKATPPQQPPPIPVAASQAAATPQPPALRPAATQATPSQQRPPIQVAASQTAATPQPPALRPAATPQPPVSESDPAPETPASQPAPSPKQFQLPRSDPPPSTPVLTAAAALPQAPASPAASIPQTAVPRLNPPPPAPAQSTTTPVEPATAKPATQSTTTPVQPAPAKPAALSTPSVQIATRTTSPPAAFAEPQVKERVLPTVSASVLRLISPAVVVNVKVQIDDQGKVVKAESLTHGPALVNTLADAAVEAARHWRFAPARRGDQNVASETVLNFAFRPPN